MLDEETSKHVVQVLRMKEGAMLNLTDGKGHLLTAEVTVAHKNHCTVLVRNVEHEARPARQIIIAISLLKNTNRFEWFLEKAAELGVSAIIPLRCERTEKEKFRYDRLKNILVSAMLQSQQVWLPKLYEPKEFRHIKTWLPEDFESDNWNNFIAHCLPDDKQPLSQVAISAPEHSLICIGPEGDFTPQEIQLALGLDFVPVSLGNTRLRTETAGIVAATLLTQGLQGFPG